MISGPYGIVDVAAGGEASHATALLDALLAGGIRIIQLRAKALPGGPLLALALDFRRRTSAAGALLVINDRPDVATLAEADAVHLGQDDLPIARVRAMVPSTLRIGGSCHSLAQVEAACAAGADYLGYGPVFPTRSKADPDPVVGLDGLTAACARAGDTPVVGIGGITLAQLSAVRAAGARSAAMIGALTQVPDPAAAAREAMARWGA